MDIRQVVGVCRSNCDLVSVSGLVYVVVTTYDEAGQVVNDSKFRAMGFGYDANGRMIKATKPNTPDAATVYDALGNRVATEGLAEGLGSDMRFCKQFHLDRDCRFQGRELHV